jgi:hypothetical protein
MSGYWTHIVVKQHFPETDETVYSIREGHFNAKGELWGYSTEPISPVGDSPDDLVWMLRRMLEAATNGTPPYEDGKAVFAKPDWEKDDE